MNICHVQSVLDDRCKTYMATILDVNFVGEGIIGNMGKRMNGI